MIITTEHELEKLISEAMQAPAVALDTEFVWERTFYPGLGLIQLAIERECYFIDPLQVKDLSSLGQLLSCPDVVKILHDAQQDLTILKDATGAVPANIFDTRLAYGFCSLSSSLSLSALLTATIGISLSKTETRTNWLQRPLTEKQLKYGANDVKYLTETMHFILQQATRQHTLTWLKEEMKRYEQPELYTEINPRMVYRKIRGIDRLNGQQLAVLQELAAWREKTARELNRSRGHIVHNNSLVDIVYNLPRNIDELKGINRLHPRAIAKYGKDLLDCIQAGLKVTRDLQPAKTPKFSQRRDLKLIQQTIRHKAETINIDPALLCSSRELTAILTSSPEENSDKSLFNGWRGEFMQDIYRNREIAALLKITN